MGQAGERIFKRLNVVLGMPRPKNSASVRTVFLVVLLVSLVATTGLASGHAKLLKSEPAPRAVLRTPPKLVRAWFDDELDPQRSSLSVWDSRGRRVDDGHGGVDLGDLDRKSMIAKLKPIRAGKYTVKWRAVSADDKFVAQGAFQFMITR